MTQLEATSSEQLATPAQTQTVIDEADRILAHVQILPAYARECPVKTRWHEHTFFEYFPEGMPDPEDPAFAIQALIAWDNARDWRICVYAGTHAQDGLQLRRRVYPPIRILSGHIGCDPFEVAPSMAEAAHQSRHDRGKRLHSVTTTQASEIIERLQGLSPAPQELF